jgi:hypothetical protein
MNKHITTTYLLSIDKEINLEQSKVFNLFKNNAFKQKKINDISFTLLNKDKTLSGYINQCLKRNRKLNPLSYFNRYCLDCLPYSILNLTDEQKKIIAIHSYNIENVYSYYDFFPNELDLTLIEESYLYLLKITSAYTDYVLIEESIFNILDNILKKNKAEYTFLSSKHVMI